MSGVSWGVALKRLARPRTNYGQTGLSVLQGMTLPRQPAAIDGDDGAVNVCRGVRRQEDGHTFDVFRRAPAAGGNARQNVPASFRIVSQRLGIVGSHVSRRDRVHIDGMRRELI